MLQQRYRGPVAEIKNTREGGASLRHFSQRHLNSPSRGIGLEELRIAEVGRAAEVQVGEVLDVGVGALLDVGGIEGTPGDGDVVDEIAVLRAVGGEGAGGTEGGVEIVVVAGVVDDVEVG